MKIFKNVISVVLFLLATTSFAAEKIAVSEASKDPFFKAVAGVWTLSEQLEGKCAEQVTVDLQKGYISQLDAVSLYSGDKNNLLYRFGALNSGTYYFWGKAIQETLERVKSSAVSAYTLSAISRGYTVFGIDERTSLTGHFSQIHAGPVQLHLSRALTQSTYLTVLKEELQDCVYSKATVTE